MTELGPVSAMLEAELREQARQHGVIVWLDKDGTFTGFADRLRARGVTDAFPIPVRCLRGSYLELMLALEDLEDGVGMTALVVHVLGLNQDTIAATPLFELYRAGRRYQRALPTLVREAALGRATAEAIEGFLAGPDVTLDRADAWLGGVEAQQPGGGPDLGALGPDALFEALLPGGSLAAQLDQPVIDARAPIDLEPLARIFESPAIVKVIHNATFERSVLARANIALANMFDTLVASRRIRGRLAEGHSLAAVCRRELDKVLDKSQQTSDWTRRPLTDAQIAYAALDVEVLVQLYELFVRIQPELPLGSTGP
jgi:hypothetical protein